MPTARRQQPETELVEVDEDGSRRVELARYSTLPECVCFQLENSQMDASKVNDARIRVVE